MPQITLLSNSPISAPVASPWVPLNAKIQHASYEFDVTSPDTPEAQFELAIEVTGDGGQTTTQIGDFRLENPPAGQVVHGRPVPISSTEVIVAEIPDTANQSGKKIRLNAKVVTGGTWTVSATATS
jgi:hypothetical protein